MKQFIILAAGMCLFNISCSQFPTQLGYIDEAKIQPVGFIFSPYAEGAPGDTLRLNATFAGDTIRSYTCSLSTYYSRLISSQSTPNSQSTGISDTAFGFVNVSDPNAIVTSHAISLSLAIPADFFNKNPVNLQSILSGTPFSQWTFDSVSSFLTSTDFSKADSMTCFLGARLSQLVSGKIILHIAVNGEFTIARSIVVRYNAKITGNKDVYVNNNPSLNWIGIYKTSNAESFSSFEPGPLDTLLCLYAIDTATVPTPRRFTDTLIVDKGFSYYSVADSGALNGGINRDKSRDNAGEVGYEWYNYLWFYQSDIIESNDVDPQNQLVIDNESRNYITQVFPPTDCSIQHAQIWLRVSDSFRNEYNRPIGVSLYNLNVNFQYTDAYRKSPGK